MIKIPSEGRENPVQQVIFYRKPKGKNQPADVLVDEEVKDMVKVHAWDIRLKSMYICPREVIVYTLFYIQTSMLVVPQAFIECEVRLYDKREANQRTNEDKEALQ